jgi:hypothetical protein
MPLISKEVILALVVLYLFSNSKQKYNLFFVLLRAYQLSDNFISYINSVLTPEHFTFDKIENDSTGNSSDNHKPDNYKPDNYKPDNHNTDIKYENKYLEEIKKLNKEFTFDNNEESLKLEKYMEFITILKENKLDIYVNKLNVIKEKLTKFEKGEDTCYLSDSEKDYCISNIKEEQDNEEQINILLKEKADVQAEYDKLNAYLESDEGKEQIMKDIQKETVGMSSTELIGDVKERFDELSENGYDWKSFYNGWIEGRTDLAYGKEIKNKESIVFIILQRILAFSFFFGIAFVGALTLFLKWIVNFIRYGGESIAYTDKTRRKTIMDVFQKIKHLTNK